MRISLGLLLSLAASPAAAQLPLDGCIDRADRPVRGVVRNDMSWAGMATVEKGESIIYWNQRLMGGQSRTTQIFVYLHECGHHLLGHVWKPNAAKWEQEADCWAVQLMWEGGMIAGRHLRVLEQELSRTRGDAIHLGGDELLAALRGCLAIKTDRRAWSAALASLVEAGADSFTAIRGQGIPAPSSSSGLHESLVDLPGTYDCEVTRTPAFRCTVFAAKDADRVSERFRELARIVPAALPPSWSSEETEPAPEGIVHELVGRDSVAGLQLSLVATPAHRIVFAMELLRGEDPPSDAPMLPVDPVAFRAETAPGPAEPAETRDESGTPRERGAFVLHQGVLVRIKVPALGREWVRARAARTASATPCILFELDIDTPDGQKRYAMLRGVTAIEVDARMWDGPVLNLPAEEAEWTPVPLEGIRRQDAGCRR
ncbi:MAG TPA: hypothetical protein VFT04_01955 [Gemmatimonadales bacterium]|nr:hypothetical protein [Gemmatimonadales bacterium]